MAQRNFLASLTLVRLKGWLGIYVDNRKSRAVIVNAKTVWKEYVELQDLKQSLLGKRVRNSQSRELIYYMSTTGPTGPSL